MRTDRRRDLLRILREGRASSQSEIVGALRAIGHDVTQATVSRDLQEVGAAKVRVGDRVAYRLADAIPHGSTGDLVARNLQRTLQDFAVDIRQAASLVVVTTAPGHASAVARAIDISGVAAVVGTVAGDDTIFVATPSNADAARVVRQWTSERRAGKDDKEHSR